MGRVRRVLRWIRRVVVGAVAFAVLAIAVVLIALHTDWGREQVRKRAEAALAESFPGGARIGRVEGSVLGALVLRDIELRDADHQPTVTIDRLTLDVGYRALLRGEIALESLALDGVTVRVRMPAGGGPPNVATLSIRTTNDMPIVQPPSFTALQLVPFQINAHYLDPDPDSRHMGETREERIRQFHEEHATPVLGLREGCMLRVEGERMELRGTTAARLFQRGSAPVEFTPPCDLSSLLQPDQA